MSINTTYSGVLNIDKPKGWTSHDVVNEVRHLANMKRVGHAGTLDPMATGVLLVMLGNTTRLMEYVHDFKKTYHATITLGGTSDTDDALGNVTPRDIAVPPTEETIQNTISTFIGDIDQIPPSYAAIKVQGKKLYEYARANKVIEKKPRPVTIHTIELLNYTYPTIDIRVTCSSGTYIRSLARDIGDILKTGGYLSQLRREAIGPFTIQDSVTLKGITPDTLPSHLAKPEKLISELPSFTLTPADITKAQYGQSIPQPNTSLPSNTPIALFGENKTFVGIGVLDEKKSFIQPKKILVQ